MPQPVLSIGMIVKNEIRCIEKCLKALQPLRNAIPCELVIADTGSTDGTREIAQQYADILFDFEWIKDFSAARNAVMDRCSGQWYLSVDADEYLDSEYQQLVEFLRSPVQKITDLACVIIRNYSKPDMSDQGSDAVAIRMVRMALGIRYEGSIHEAWIFTPQKVQILSDVIFHHDGYAYTSQEQLEQKEIRNLKLLEAELEKAPEDLRRINQCLESSWIWKDKSKKYATYGMELLLKNEALCEKLYAVELCKSSIRTAAEQDLPEMKEWLAFGDKHFTGKGHFEFDATYYAALYYVIKKKYDLALQWAERYCKAYQLFAKKPKLEQLKEKVASPICFENEVARHRITVIRAGCLAQLERKEEAVKILLSISSLDVMPEFFLEYIQTAQKLRDNKLVQKQAGLILTKVLNDTSEDEVAQKNRQWILFNFKYCFMSQEEKRYQLFKYVEGDMGLVCRIMDATPKEMKKELLQILNWNAVHPVLLQKILELGVPFPDSFYERPIKSIRASMESILKLQKEDSFNILFHWLDCNEKEESILKIHFRYELLLTACQKFSWDDVKTGHTLLQYVLSVGKEFLEQYYQDDLLEKQEYWKILNPIHQYTLLLLDGVYRLENRDEIGWVNCLRAALEMVPAMKNMIQFLMDHPPVVTVNQELVRLSEQVKTLLSQYPKDDPAVLAIKQSPIYQKVAHLIE